MGMIRGVRLARPGSFPGGRYVALYRATAFPTLPLIGFVLLLTPTGSLPSPRWRWWAWVAAAAPVVFLLAVTLAPERLHPQDQLVNNPFDLRGLGGGRPGRLGAGRPGCPGPARRGARCLPGGPAAGDRRGGRALPAVRPGPHRQPRA